jgi:hypothetical protein
MDPDAVANAGRSAGDDQDIAIAVRTALIW